MVKRIGLIHEFGTRTRLIFAALVISMGLIPGFSFADGVPKSTAHIVVDGKSVSSRAIVQNNHLLVPAVFFRHLGAQVNWNNDFQSVALKKNNIQISLPSGKQHADYTTSGTSSWKRDQLQTITLDQMDGTYIPLRYAAEKVGLEVTYHPETNIVKLDTQSNGSHTNTEDEKWLYQITEAEAGGESHQGKVAVAATILNRVKSPDWPNTINQVIFQVVHDQGVDYYQFSPVQDGRIYQVRPSKDTVNAVKEALHGADPTKGATVFYNPEKTDNQWVRSKPVTVTIGNHIFSK